jgi:hypothetical protein
VLVERGSFIESTVTSSASRQEPDTPHSARKNQRQQILDHLLAAKGGWVPAPTLAAISLQYSARVREARLEGFVIENKVDMVCGKKFGMFRIPVSAPTRTQAQPERDCGGCKVASSLDRPSLFPDLGQAHRDDG